MIRSGEGIFPLAEGNDPGVSRINILKKKIHDENYLSEAIQRIAQVLSNEITGGSGERKRRK